MGYTQSLCLSGKANEVPQVPNIIFSSKYREKGVLGSVQGIGEEETEPLCGRVADGDAVNNARIPYTVAMLGVAWCEPNYSFMCSGLHTAFPGMSHPFTMTHCTF